MTNKGISIFDVISRKEETAFRRIQKSCHQLTLLFPLSRERESLHHLFASLSERQKHQLLIDPFFFVIKNSEIRLRFPSSRQFQQTITEWKDWCNQLSRDGIIESSRWSNHFPELFQFGGLEAYNIVQDHFIAESLILAKYYNIIYPIESHGSVNINRLDLITVDVADLFVRLTDDSWEAWDCVARYAYVRDMLSDIERTDLSHTPSPSSPISRWINSPIEAFSGLSADFQACYFALGSANEKTSARLRSVEQKVNFGLRNLAVVLAIYLLNRAKTNHLQQSKMLLALSTILNPVKHICSFKLPFCET